MRKILTFLAVIVVCAGCKNYQADIDNYLSYWSTQATIARYSFDPAAVQIDSEKIQNIPSSSDVNVILTVRNPKNFTFKMPQDPGAPADIVVFPTDVTGTAGGAPTQPTDYTLTQDSNSQLTLTYKKAFLQKYESVKKNIGPTIKLYAADGRPFSNPFTLNVKANTPPPNLIYRAIGKTATVDGSGKYYYVVFLEAKGMEATINGSDLLHKDIKYLSIAEGSEPIPLTVKADKSGFDISGAGGRLLAHTATAQLDSAEVESGVTPDNISALNGGWILRVKTDVEVKVAQKEYRFRLQDEAGLRSTEALRASTSTNKVKPVTITVQKTGRWTVTQKSGTNADPHEITYLSGVLAVPLTAETETSGATVYYKLEGNGTVTENSGTTPLTINVPAAPAAAQNTVYKLTVYANKNGFDRCSDVVVYYKLNHKLNRTNTLEISAGQDAWKKLKAAVTAAKDGDVIIVDGTITATSDSGNNGEIAVTKSITIRGKSGAGTDILNANGTNGSKPAHRIFKVTDCDLTLEGLTLKGGMATDTETLGGGIYCNNSEKLTIKNCSIQDCTASSSGGGIYIKTEVGKPSTEVTIADTQILQNTAVQSGGGIYITTGASGQVNGTLILKDGARISGNSAKNGGGIAVDSAKVYMEGATTSIGGAHGDKNTATAYGGGVYVSDGIFTMSGGIITGNDALKGGGVYGGTKGEIIIKGSSEISENTATMSGTLAGGGIESDYKLTIKDSALIQQNHAPNGFGGGIASGQGAQFDFIGGKVTDNTAGSNGKGIYINSFMSNAYFKISGNVYVDSNNDVFLGGTQASEYAYITIIGTLTKTLVAPLTMNNTHGYGVGRVVVKGSENHSLTEQDAAKFTVTPQDASGVSKFWQINSEGKLEILPSP